MTSLQVATKPPPGSGSSRSSTTRPSRRADLVGERRLGPAQQGVVERQQGGKAVVGDLQPAVLVEGGDAHADMVEAVAQDVVVVADRLRRLVDQRAGAARQQPAAPAERADDHARRRRSQRARQHALGLRQRGRQRHRPAQRPLGTFGADEAGQQVAQFGETMTHRPASAAPARARRPARRHRPARHRRRARAPAATRRPAAAC